MYISGVYWFEVGSKSVPAVHPLPLLPQHLFPLTSLCPTHTTHPREPKLATFLVTFDLPPPEDGGGEGGDGGVVSDVATGVTEE